MTQRTLFRLLLLGLPAGLFISIVAGLWLYYHPLPSERRDSRRGATALLRHSPAAADLRDHRRILTTDLALRPTSDLPALSRAANWIESTLGPSNMGFTVRRLDLTTAGGPTPLLYVELPGRRAPAEVTVISTGFDTDDPDFDSGSSAAALLTLANAFVGTPQSRTLVFAWHSHDRAVPPARTGPQALLDGLRASGRTVQGVIDLRVARVPEPDPSAPARPPHLALFGPAPADPWFAEVRAAILPRLPASLPAPTPSPAAPPFSELPWWRQSPPAASVALLVLTPATPDDEASLLAFAQALEGTVQALANR